MPSLVRKCFILILMTVVIQCIISNVCNPNPCKNGGTCNVIEISEGQQDFDCECKSGFKGVNCEKDEKENTDTDNNGNKDKTDNTVDNKDTNSSAAMPFYVVYSISWSVISYLLI